MSFTALRDFVRTRERAAERCDACARPIAPAHEHLIDPRVRTLRCACDACARVLGGAAWIRVPRAVRFAEGLALDDAAWGALAIPIGLAFFHRRLGGAAADAAPVVATFPSPAGPTEAPLPEEAWRAIGAPTLADAIEALLVRRLGDARDAFVVSIDLAFALTGIVRAKWRGPSGGGDLWRAIDLFFTDLRAEAGRREPCRP